jgi:DNA-binding transcriptional LysR family regulator
LSPVAASVENWEFKRGERSVNVHAKGRLAFNQNELVVDAGLAGHGSALAPEDRARKHLATGRLVTVLDGWVTTSPGHHLYYAMRHSGKNRAGLVILHQ